MIIALFVIAYFLGSIPFGLLISRAAGLGDVRKIGSGNIGATNVMRTGRKGLAILTLLCDAGKGFAAVWLARTFVGGNITLLAGLIVILGHIFPVWLKFKGGKGVATALGTLFALNVLSGLAFCFVWIAIFIMTLYSSLAALTAMMLVMATALMEVYDVPGYSGYALMLCGILFFTHRQNINRLIAGTEAKFGKKTP